MDLKIYRTATVLTLTTWDEKNKAFMEITPAKDGAAKGQPKPGEKRYDYDKTLRISFKPLDMLVAAFKLQAMSHGVSEKLEKIGDMSKVAGSDSKDKKFLNIFPSDKGGVFVGLSMGSEKVSMILNNEEIFAIAKWFEIQAAKFFVKDIPRGERDSDDE